MTRIAFATLPLAALGLAGCETTESVPDSGAMSAPEEFALFGDGYPNPGDPCQRAGESEFTNQYLSDAADLVACPPGTDPGLFASSTGGSQVAEQDGWLLFTVPRR